MEKISARIAVSEDARRTLVEHFGGDAVVIPNGVYVNRFATADPRPSWQATPGHPTIAFVGRLDESRKGLPVLAQAVPAVLRRFPGARFLLLGRGDGEQALDGLDPAALAAIDLLGQLEDDDKGRAAALGRRLRGAADRR